MDKPSGLSKVTDSARLPFCMADTLGRMEVRPANQGDFVSFIKKSGDPTLKQFGISHAEELFEPADDGQSIVVSYGRTNVTDPNPVIAYESQTVGDKRRVLRSTGAVEELAESDFQKHRSMTSTK